MLPYLPYKTKEGIFLHPVVVVYHKGFILLIRVEIEEF